MNLTIVLKKFALAVHLFHEKAYTYWKVRESGQYFRSPLTLPEMSFFVKFMPLLKKPGLVVYDIGASVGVVTGCFAKTSNIAVVHAFEPIPRQFHRLQVKMANFPHVTCHQVALGDVNRVLSLKVMDKALDASSFLSMSDLHRQEFSGSFDYDEESVPVVRLDDYVQEKDLPTPSLVKIDVQGFEDRVLRGGWETMGRAGYCFLEISFQPLYEGSPIFDDIYRLMRELGFRLMGVADIVKGKSGIPLQIDAIFENERLI